MLWGMQVSEQAGAAAEGLAAPPAGAFNTAAQSPAPVHPAAEHSSCSR